MENNAQQRDRHDAALPALPVFPVRLAQSAAFDKTSRTLYVTNEIKSHPLLLTWQHDMHAHLKSGVMILVVSIDEIAQMRSRGMAVYTGRAADGGEAAVRNAALDMIRAAAEYGASDLHLLMRGSYSEAQVRVKGDLYVLKRMRQEEGEEISRALFQGIATVKDGSYTPLEDQNAQISGDEIAPMGLTSVRLVRGPAFPVDEGGGFVVMRLQYGETRKFKSASDLDQPRFPPGELNLGGYSEEQVERFKFLARCPSGLIVVTGPTGSGKTTTLYEMLKHIARERPGSRLVTIEDPVEYPMPWAVQLVVTNAAGEEATGSAFNARLRTALRMDPDIILIGELRGADTAIAAFNGALTGHQVWTTAHVNDPFQTITRFELMDHVRLARGFTCDHVTLRGLTAQRLIKLLCQNCAVSASEADLPASMVAALKTHGDISRMKVRGPGCAHCTKGIESVTAVAEVVNTSRILMRDMIGLGVDEARRNHRANPDADNAMIDQAIRMILDGRIDPRDVEDSVDVIQPTGCEA